MTDPDGPGWQPAQGAGRILWDHMMGQRKRCPYCWHPRETHSAILEEGPGRTTIRCDHCWPHGAHPRTCIVMEPAPGARAERTSLG